MEKQGRPPLKNKNSSDLSHFEIKFGKKGKFYFKKKVEGVYQVNIFSEKQKILFPIEKKFLIQKMNNLLQQSPFKLKYRSIDYKNL